VWQYSLDRAGRPEDVNWSNEPICVPFPPEAPLSGVQKEGKIESIWYRRTFGLDSSWQGDRILLHFNAVDYQATVWINGRFAGGHEGGHTPFGLDITEHLEPGADQEVVVLAKDDPAELDKPRGKQDWLDQRHSIWYPRTTGIWQEVWLEPVPAVRIESVRITPSVSDFAIDLEVVTSGTAPGMALSVKAEKDEVLLCSDTWTLTDRRIRRRIHFPDPGIDDAREAFLWSPENPNLIDLTLALNDHAGPVDEVSMYTALRSIDVRDGKFHLNGRPYFLRMVLDQGYWEESLLAAPDGGALKRDVELAKAMGFNGVRKHQKVEDPRYLYWADRLGLLVWSELPSAYSFTPASIARLTREWLEVLQRDYNHPCIVAWVPFNESWGVPELPVSASQRHLVEALYHLAKSFDSSRPVVGNDGWEFVVGDLFTVHDYDSDAKSLEGRYRDQRALENLSARSRPADVRSLSTGSTWACRSCSPSSAGSRWQTAREDGATTRLTAPSGCWRSTALSSRRPRPTLSAASAIPSSPTPFKSVTASCGWTGRRR
jgi:beta-galactosidase/beta-glucuronidase